MSYENYRIIFIAALILSLLFLLTTVFLFFYFKIKDVIGYFTGSSKRKAIEDKKNKGSKKANQTAAAKPKAASYDTSQTSKLNPQDRFDTTAPAQSEPPVVKAANAMSVETTQLNAAAYPRKLAEGFMLKYEIVFVHSNEIIKGE